MAFGVMFYETNSSYLATCHHARMGHCLVRAILSYGQGQPYDLGRLHCLVRTLPMGRKPRGRWLWRGHFHADRNRDPDEHRLDHSHVYCDLHGLYRHVHRYGHANRNWRHNRDGNINRYRNSHDHGYKLVPMTCAKTARPWLLLREL